jgi:hypothetical protein
MMGANGSKQGETSKNLGNPQHKALENQHKAAYKPKQAAPGQRQAAKA